MGLRRTKSPGAGWLRDRVHSFPVTIDSGCVDARSVGATHQLLGGLILGEISATGKYTNYDRLNDDGSEVGKLVLMGPVDMKNGDGAAASTDHRIEALKIGTVVKEELGGYHADVVAQLTLIEIQSQ